MNERDKEFARQAKLPVMHPDWQEAAQAFANLIRADEREKFCAALRQLHDSYSLASNSNSIRTRGNT